MPTRGEVSPRLQNLDVASQRRSGHAKPRLKIFEAWRSPDFPPIILDRFVNFQLSRCECLHSASPSC